MHIVPPDVLTFIQASFPAGISSKIAAHYGRTGRLPEKVRIQTDLKGGCEVYYPRRAYAAEMFSLARQAVSSPAGCAGRA